MLAIDVAQEEDVSPPPQPAHFAESPSPSPAALPELHILEKKVQPDIDDAADRDPTRWILDTGASNHMSGSRAAFADLDTGVTGAVRFGDGSVARIEGTGTVLFHCKNGEHRRRAPGTRERLLPPSPHRQHHLRRATRRRRVPGAGGGRRDAGVR